MPRKPKRPCRYPGCPNLTDNKSGWCDAHEKKMQQHYEHFARGYDHRARYGGSWPKVRARYLHAHPLCERCAAAGRYVKAREKSHVALRFLPRADSPAGEAGRVGGIKSLSGKCLATGVGSRVKNF